MFETLLPGTDTPFTQERAPISKESEACFCCRFYDDTLRVETCGLY